MDISWRLWNWISSVTSRVFLSLHLGPRCLTFQKFNVIRHLTLGSTINDTMCIYQKPQFRWREEKGQSTYLLNEKFFKATLFSKLSVIISWMARKSSTTLGNLSGKDGHLTKTSLENKLLGNGDHFVTIASSSHPLLLTWASCKRTDRGAVEVNTADERFTFLCYLKFGNFTLPFCRVSQTCCTISFPYSTNPIIVFWRRCCRRRHPCLSTPCYDRRRIFQVYPTRDPSTLNGERY